LDSVWSIPLEIAYTFRRYAQALFVEIFDENHTEYKSPCLDESVDKIK